MLNSTAFEKLGNVVRVYFSVPFQGALIKGLTASSFTIKLWDPNDVDVAGTGPGLIPVTVTELGGSGVSGRYYAEYTNDEEEEWKLELFHPIYAPTGASATAMVYEAEHGDSNDDSAVLDFKVWVGQTPITGLVTGSFTYELWNPAGLDVSGSIATSIVELGGGSYRAKFSAATAEGDWLSAVKHATYFPTGLTGVWRYRAPVIPGAPTIADAVNDGTGNSATLTFVADDPADELFPYYRKTNEVVWTLFGGSRVGSGTLQITGLTEAVTEFIAVASREGSASENPSAPSTPVRLYVTDGLPSYTGIRDALYDWVNDQTPWKTIWKNSNAPQPPLPFMAIRMFPTLAIGEDSHSGPDANGDDTIVGDREFSFTVELVGDDSPTAEDLTWTYAEQIASSLQTRGVLDTLAVAGIAYVERQPIQDLTAVGSVLYQARALVELRFRIANEMVETLNWIDTADMPLGTYQV